MFLKMPLLHFSPLILHLNINTKISWEFVVVSEAIFHFLVRGHSGVLLNVTTAFCCFQELISIGNFRCVSGSPTAVHFQKAVGGMSVHNSEPSVGMRFSNIKPCWPLMLSLPPKISLYIKYSWIGRKKGRYRTNFTKKTFYSCSLYQLNNILFTNWKYHTKQTYSVQAVAITGVIWLAGCSVIKHFRKVKNRKSSKQHKMYKMVADGLLFITRHYI